MEDFPDLHLTEEEEEDAPNTDYVPGSPSVGAGESASKTRAPDSDAIRSLTVSTDDGTAGGTAREDSETVLEVVIEDDDDKVGRAEGNNGKANPIANADTDDEEEEDEEDNGDYMSPLHERHNTVKAASKTRLPHTRSGWLLHKTYGSPASSAKIEHERRNVLRDVEKGVKKEKRRKKKNLLLAFIEAQQISAEEAKGAFTVNPQQYGSGGVADSESETDRELGWHQASNRHCQATESTFCMVLSKTRHWKSRHIEVTALHAMVINQLTVAGLRCVMMPESMLMAEKGVVLIGLKATPQALLKEQDTKNTETSLRMLSVGQTSDLRKVDTPSTGDVTAHGSLKFKMAPADEILLTQRIINRALEVLRVHQGDKEKYLINRTSCLECLKNSFECCLGCYPARRYDVFQPTGEDLLEVQGNPDDEGGDGLHPGESKKLLRKPLTLAGEPGKADNIIQQVFPLHDKRVNHHLWHMFWRELFCGLCCKVAKFDHYPMLRFCDEVSQAASSLSSG